MQVQPYLFFNGRCEEALQFYAKAVDAKVEMLMRFKDSPEPQPPGMQAPADTAVMASDGMCSGTSSFQGFSLSLNARDDAQARRLFAALSEGGQVQMPLSPSFFASSFGMVTDRFGVGWMVVAQKGDR